MDKLASKNLLKNTIENIIKEEAKSKYQFFSSQDAYNRLLYLSPKGLMGYKLKCYRIENIHSETLIFVYKSVKANNFVFLLALDEKKIKKLQEIEDTLFLKERTRIEASEFEGFYFIYLAPFWQNYSRFTFYVFMLQMMFSSYKEYQRVESILGKQIKSFLGGQNYCLKDRSWFMLFDVPDYEITELYNQYWSNNTIEDDLIRTNKMFVQPMCENINNFGKIVASILGGVFLINYLLLLARFLIWPDLFR